MKWIIILQICLVFTSCCNKTDSDCSSDEISYGEIDCIKKEAYTFYHTDVNFYCLDRSILIGLDLEKSVLKPYYINTLNPVKHEVMGSVGKINYSHNLAFIGFNIECEINNSSKVTWVLIDDKGQFNTIPDAIKVKLILKESVDFNSKTLEEKDVILMKR